MSSYEATTSTFSTGKTTSSHFCTNGESKKKQRKYLYGPLMWDFLAAEILFCCPRVLCSAFSLMHVCLCALNQALGPCTGSPAAGLRGARWATDQLLAAAKLSPASADRAWYTTSALYVCVCVCVCQRCTLLEFPLLQPFFAFLLGVLTIMVYDGENLLPVVFIVRLESSNPKVPDFFLKSLVP